MNEIAPQPPRRRWPLFASVLALLAAVILTGWLWRIEIASWALQRELAARGFDKSTITIAQLEFDRIELAPARLGPDLNAAKIVAQFDLRRLFEGRFDTVKVHVQELEVEVSSPQTGALGRLQAIAAVAPQSGSSTAIPSLPSITLTDARIHGQAGPARPDVRFGATVISTSDSIRIVLNHAQIIDNAESPLFLPFSASGEGNLLPGKANFAMQVSAADNGIKLDLNAHYDLYGDIGGADWRLSSVTLGNNGVQLSRLSPLAADVDRTLSARLQATGSIGWNGGILDADLTASIADASANWPSLRLSKGAAELEIKCQSAKEKCSWNLRDAYMDADTADRQERLRNLRVQGVVFKTGSSINANSRVSGDLEPGPGARDHPTININGSVQLLDFDDITATLGARALNGRLRVVGVIDHKLATGVGQAAVNLDKLKFDQQHLQPKHLSRLIDFPGTLDGTLSAIADVNWGSSGVDGRARINLENFGYHGQGIAVRGFDGDLSIAPLNPSGPITVSLKSNGAELSADGREFAVGPLTIDGDWKTGAFEARGDIDSLRHIALQPSFMPLGATFSVRGDENAVDFTADFTQNNSIRLKSEGRYEVAGSDLRARVSVPPLQFSEGGLTPAKITPLLNLVDSATGALAGGADIRFNKGELSGTAHASLENLSIHKGDTRIEGITGRLDLSQLMPPLTHGDQTLNAGRIVAGAELLAPSFTYRIETSPAGPLPRLAIKVAHVGVAGGTVSLRPTRIDANLDDHDIDLDLIGVDLKTLMDLIAVEGVSAEGKLSGRLPIHINRENVFVRNGELKTAGPGVLRIRSEAASQALASGGAQVELVLNVLRDFRYKKLSLTINRLEDGSDIVRLSTEGHNPAVKNGREIHLNVNLETNLDKLLAIALDGYRLSQNALRATLGGVSRK